MYHSITIGDKNTWDDWHLIPSERPIFLPPDVKTSYIETHSADGSIDLSEDLSGRPLYSDRKGSWDFYVANGYKRWNILLSRNAAVPPKATSMMSSRTNPIRIIEKRNFSMIIVVSFLLRSGISGLLAVHDK